MEILKIYIKDSDINGKIRVGCLVGVNKGVINNVYIDNSVQSKNRVDGIVGNMKKGIY